MKQWSPVWLYAVLAAAVAVWLVQGWTSDRRRIERRLGELASLIEKEGGESPLEAANKARQVADLLSRDFAVHLEPYGQVVTDRQRLAQVTLAYRDRARRIAVDFTDREVEVDAQLRRAAMSVVATVGGELDGGPFRERYRLRLGWREEEGAWVIERLDLVEVLEGPGGVF